jgi:glycosyltransferase involved in cell wall biosynthesis
MSRGSIVILIPVFNDWASLARLLPRLDAVLAARGLAAEVLVVDDGSTLEPEGDAIERPFLALRRVDVLRLRRNLGHQRAITVGLAYVEDCLRPQAVVVMDGDGEDDPADVPRLLDQLEQTGQTRIVFAERTRRSESVGFRAFYALYRLLHFVLTGQPVRVGNFSAIPRGRLSSLVVVTELWNHYAAAVIRSRQPHCLVPTRRSDRLCGRSTMNFVALVTHGLSAISVYSDVVGVRLLVLSVLLALVTLGGICAAVVVRLTTAWAIPGWATSTVGWLLVLLVQAVLAAFVFSFVILGARHGSSFLPRRDYSFFVGSVRTLHGPEPSVTPLPGPERVGEVPW